MSMPFMFYALAVTPSRRLSRHGPDFLFHKKKKDIELPFIESGLLWEATFKKNTEKPGTITNF